MKLPTTYDPSSYEPDIYSLWEQTNGFAPQGDGQPYSVVMPPPNANANLHIGYELTAALEDTIIRYKRLRGHQALLIPGADHAGFETQVVYEKHLAKTGKSRFDFTRDELRQQISDFVAQNRNNFESQLRAMGVSCDWKRFSFTLDQKIVDRAYQTFKKLWDDKLIYRGERLVNYCTYHGTAFADIEVRYHEDKGSLWHIKYPLADGSDSLVVATTRPETMLGDVAVAVNPTDERYQDFIGKILELPLTGRQIPVIADEFVEVNFGTGAVKITPAHDINDFEAAERANLPKLTVIDFDGKMSGDIPAKYKGLSVDKARLEIVHDLQEQGYLVKTEDYVHSVGHCYKCDTVLQPLLKDQWFVDMQPLAEPAIAALQEGRIKFYPAAKKEQLITYLKGLRDWNISRQIAWGIPIPAFQNVDDPNDWIYSDQVSCSELTIDGRQYRRDPDVFDTWFSSSSWPYATLGFPDDPDFAKFYPLSLMETGGEILYPWVSRMLMLGLYVTGDIPFREVYIHGYVMAADGSKMSKSIGNVVDPLPVINKYGSDALRMGIISGRAPATNRGYDERRVEEARNFCNKLWNIARYIGDLTGNDASLFMERPNPSTPADHWILDRLQETQLNLEKQLDNYNFSEGYDLIYHFVWDDLADWYLEASKSQTNTSILAWVLFSVLHIVHPYAPFLSETIWQSLRPDDHEVVTLINSHWPRLAVADSGASNDFTRLKQIITEIREVCAATKIKKPSISYFANDLVSQNENIIAKLCNVQSITSSNEVSPSSLKLISSDQPIWVNLSASQLVSYKNSLDSKREALEKTIQLLEKRLSNSSYLANAPAELVNQTKDDLLSATKQLDALKNSYQRLS